MREIILLGYLGILSVFDLRERQVPVWLLGLGTLGVVGFQIGVCIAEPSNFKWTISFALLGMLPGLFLTALAHLTEKAGSGDGWALVNAGIFAGYRISLLLLCFGTLLTAFFSIGLLAARRANRHTKLPYLPFMTAAYLAGILMKQEW